MFMKIKVKRDFYDTHHNKRLRLNGTVYDEPDQKRIDELVATGFVVQLEPKMEQPTGTPQTETKKKPGRPKKTTRKKSTS